MEKNGNFQPEGDLAMCQMTIDDLVIALENLDDAALAYVISSILPSLCRVLQAEPELGKKVVDGCSPLISGSER